MLTETEVLQQAMELPAPQREAIAQRLLESLNFANADQRAIDEEWAEEIERRASAYDRGEVQSIDGREAIERIRQSLKQGRNV